MDLLTIHKNDLKTEEENGPSIDASTAEERIQARRLRIKKKKELIQKSVETRPSLFGRLLTVLNYIYGFEASSSVGIHQRNWTRAKS
jgi:hypothetical protein